MHNIGRALGAPASPQQHAESPSAKTKEQLVDDLHRLAGMLK